MMHPGMYGSTATENRRARVRAVVALVVAGLLPVATRAAPAPTDAPPRFIIQTISVEGVARDTTSGIVIAESRIKQGQELGEDDLRLAIRRIKRLPFVVDAEFALRRGETRGQVALVIRIEMASWYFWDVSGGASLTRGSRARGGERNDTTVDLLAGASAVGVRRFVGAHGYAFASVDAGRTIRFGYTQFHLFGPASFLSVVVDANPEAGRPSYGVSLFGGKSLGKSQAVRASAVYSDQNSHVSGDDLLDFLGDLQWSFDTTDDPLLPTAGTSLGASVSWTSHRVGLTFNDGTPFRAEQSATTYGVAIRRYWALSSRRSLSADLSASTLSGDAKFGTRETIQLSSYTARLGLDYAWDLVRSRLGQPRQDLRLAARVGFLAEDEEFVGLGGRCVVLGTSLVYRRPQGAIRFSLEYRHDVQGREHGR